MAHRDDTRHRPGRERQRVRHGGAARARARLRAADAGDVGAPVAAGAHARLPLDRRRRVRRRSARCASRRAAAPPAASSPSSTSTRIAGPARRGSRSRATAALAGAALVADRGAADRSSRPASGPSTPASSAQLVDLAFPFTLYEQGPFVARGIPAITLTTAGERPPDAFDDTAGRARRTNASAQLGPGGAGRSSARSTRGSSSRSGTTSYVWVGDRIVRGWAIAARPDRAARPRSSSRRSTSSRAAGGGGSRSRPPRAALRSRLAFWLFVGLAFDAFRRWPAPGRRAARGRPTPATAAAGRLAGARARSGSRARRAARLARRARPPRAAPAGHGRRSSSRATTVGAARASRSSRSLIVATNPFALLFVLPALHVVALAAAGPDAASLGSRARLRAAGSRGRSSCSPRSRSASASASTRPGTCSSSSRSATCRLPPCRDRARVGRRGAQLAAAAAGRYAPYPAARERPARGPLREPVRTVVLTTRARRRADGRAPPRVRRLAAAATAAGS